MKGYIFSERIDPATNNLFNYLFVPDKKVIICLGPNLDEIVFKDSLASYFNSDPKRIEEVEENISLYKIQKIPGYFKYIGQIDNIPRKSFKKIDNLVNSKKQIEKINLSLRAQEKIESKKLEELIQRKFDLT